MRLIKTLFYIYNNYHYLLLGKNKEEKKLNREDLKMLYDPDELEEEYCNEKDENIVQKDMPERLQLQYPDNK